MRQRSIFLRRFGASLVLLLLVASSTARLTGGNVLAQSGGDYDVEWHIVGSAGDEFVAGGDYQLGFTLAQDQEPLISSGGDYQIVQEYWSGGALDPTAVFLVDFWVEPQEKSLLVCWETATEIDNLGFNIHRNDSGEPGSYQQINDGLIPTRFPGSSVGASYEWIDTDVASGHAYFYLMEAVDVYGVSTFYGPVSATIQPVTVIYLPLVVRCSP